VLWRADLGGRLSPPTIGEGKVFVAAVDAHRLVALDAREGKPVWRFTAGGRIDSPPTVHRGRVLFGSSDGWVYCLRGEDGALIWRFLAAPQIHRIVAFGQLESPWPVHGSVLVKDNVVYAAAGRSTHLDGGIHVYALDPATGRLIRELKPLNRNPHGLADVLVSDGKLICMRHLTYSLERRPRNGWRRTALASRAGQRAYSTAGLLDASWFSRVGWSLGHKAGDSFDLLVFDDRRVYAVSATRKGGFGGYVHPGKGGYRLVALDRSVLGRKRSKGAWSRRLPIRVRAMVVAGERLVVSGPPDVADPSDAWAALEGRKGGVLAVLSTLDGQTLSTRRLEAAPAYDGLAASGGRLILSTAGGQVLCLGKPQ
jgi:outer membrane protein assembly factor BamB